MILRKEIKLPFTDTQAKKKKYAKKVSVVNIFIQICNIKIWDSLSYYLL